MRKHQGYLSVKFTQRYRRVQRKHWRRCWVVLQRLADEESVVAKLSLFNKQKDYETASKPFATIFFDDVITVRRTSSSKGHPYAFEIEEYSSQEPAKLSGDSETSSQEWIRAIRVIFWPEKFSTIPPISDFTDMFYAAVIDNQLSRHLGITGDLLFTSSRGKICLDDPIDGAVSLQKLIESSSEGGFCLEKTRCSEDSDRILSFKLTKNSEAILSFYINQPESFKRVLLGVEHAVDNHIEVERRYKKKLRRRSSVSSSAIPTRKLATSLTEPRRRSLTDLLLPDPNNPTNRQCDEYSLDFRRGSICSSSSTYSRESRDSGYTVTPIVEPNFLLTRSRGTSTHSYYTDALNTQEFNFGGASSTSSSDNPESMAEYTNIEMASHILPDDKVDMNPYKDDENADDSESIYECVSPSNTQIFSNERVADFIKSNSDNMRPEEKQKGIYANQLDESADQPNKPPPLPDRPSTLPRVKNNDRANKVTTIWRKFMQKEPKQAKVELSSKDEHTSALPTKEDRNTEVGAAEIKELSRPHSETILRSTSDECEYVMPKFLETTDPNDRLLARASTCTLFNFDPGTCKNTIVPGKKSTIRKMNTASTSSSDDVDFENDPRSPSQESTNGDDVLYMTMGTFSRPCQSQTNKVHNQKSRVNSTYLDGTFEPETHSAIPDELKDKTTTLQKTDTDDCSLTTEEADLDVTLMPEETQEYQLEETLLPTATRENTADNFHTEREIKINKSVNKDVLPIKPRDHERTTNVIDIKSLLDDVKLTKITPQDDAFTMPSIVRKGKSLTTENTFRKCTESKSKSLFTRDNKHQLDSGVSKTIMTDIRGKLMNMDAEVHTPDPEHGSVHNARTKDLQNAYAKHGTVTKIQNKGDVDKLENSNNICRLCHESVPQALLESNLFRRQILKNQRARRCSHNVDR